MGKNTAENFIKDFFESIETEDWKSVHQMSDIDLLEYVDPKSPIEIHLNEMNRERKVALKKGIDIMDNDKQEFWQEQKQKDIICAEQKKGTDSSGTSIYISVAKFDNNKLRVYFMYSGWYGSYKKNKCPDSFYVEAEQPVKGMLEQIIKGHPIFYDKETKTEYSIKVVKPHPGINYKIANVLPDPDVNYKVIVIDPKSGNNFAHLSDKLSKDLKQKLQQNPRK